MNTTLPAGLGAFRNDPPFRNVCTNCNSRFGELDEVLTRNSVEALRRIQVGFVSVRDHRKKDVLSERTAGLPAIAIKGRIPGGESEILWEPTGDLVGKPRKQLILERPDGTRVPFALGSNVRNHEDLVKSLVARGLGDATLINFICSPEDTAAVAELCAPLLKGRTWDTKPIPGLGLAVEVIAEVPISVLYFRALAKVALHFFLKTFDNFSGFEPEFDSVKRFIYLGEAPTPRFRINRTVPIALEVAHHGYRGPWGHVLVAYYDQDLAHVSMDFFFSENFPPVMRDVWLTRRDGRVRYVEQRGFAYLADPAPTRKYHGERKEIFAPRRIAIPGPRPPVGNWSLRFPSRSA